MAEHEEHPQTPLVEAPQEAEPHPPSEAGSGALGPEAVPRPTTLGREEEIRSPAVQDILSAVPNWILRWGITVIFAVVFLVIVGAWVIHYPEIVTARIVVTTANPPAPVVARTSGQLVLLVEDHAQAAEGDLLAVIENPAHHDDVLALKETLNTLEPLIMQGAPQIGFTPQAGAVLGDVQASYSSFLQSYRTYAAFHATNYHAQSIRVLEQQIQDYQDLALQLERQRALTERELSLARKKYEADQGLFEKGHLSEVALAESERVYLGQQQALETINANQINNTIQQAQQQKAMLDLQHQYDEQKRTYTTALQTTHKQLKSRLLAWEEQFLLKAPISGRVSFFTFWSDNQFVRANAEVMMVVPTRASNDALVGKVFLPRVGAGRVKAGQAVRIKFDSYPFNDFGAVVGRVESISLVAREDQYGVAVHLPDGLRTTYGRTLDFKQEMQGTAEIITEDLRLIERVFNQFRSILGEAQAL